MRSVIVCIVLSLVLTVQAATRDFPWCPFLSDDGASACQEFLAPKAVTANPTSGNMGPNFAEIEPSYAPYGVIKFSHDCSPVSMKFSLTFNAPKQGTGDTDPYLNTDRVRARLYWMSDVDYFDENGNPRPGNSCGVPQDSTTLAYESPLTDCPGIHAVEFGTPFEVNRFGNTFVFLERSVDQGDAADIVAIMSAYSTGHTVEADFVVDTIESILSVFLGSDNPELQEMMSTYFFEQPLYAIICLIAIAGYGTFIVALPLELCSSCSRTFDSPHADGPKSPLFGSFLFFLGFPLAIHRFYVKKPISAVLQIVTLGGLGIWWLIDGFMVQQLVLEHNRSVAEEMRSARNRAGRRKARELQSRGGGRTVF